MELDVGHLRTLVDAADRGSISAVARVRGCTPSAVSQQLAALEERTGAALLDRSNRGVRLTLAGRRLVEQARGILLQLERAARELEDVSTDGAPHGTVRIGAVASAAATLVSDAVHAVEHDYPDVAAWVCDLEPTHSLDAVRLGDLEVAVVDCYEHVPAAPTVWAHEQVLVTEPLVVVLPPDVEVAPGPVALADLADERWVAADDGAACGEAVRFACYAAGFVPDVAWVTDDLHLSVAHVAAGHGVALLSLLVAHDRIGQVQLRPVRGTRMTRRLVAVTRADPPPARAAIVLVDALLEAGRDWQGRIDALESDLLVRRRGRG